MRYLCLVAALERSDTVTAGWPAAGHAFLPPRRDASALRKANSKHCDEAAVELHGGFPVHAGHDGLEIHARLLVAADDPGGDAALLAYDVSNPAAPLRLALEGLPAPNAVAAGPTHGYVGTAAEGVIVLEPAEIDVTPTPGEPTPTLEPGTPAGGYKVYEAQSGIEALDVMVEAGGKIDLVVSDVVMPELDGPSLLKELRKKRPDLKIIFISGYAEDAFKKNLPEGEDFQFLPKPFSLKQLAVAVKETLGR